MLIPEQVGQKFLQPTTQEEEKKEEKGGKGKKQRKEKEEERVGKRKGMWSLRPLNLPTPSSIQSRRTL